MKPFTFLSAALGLLLVGCKDEQGSASTSATPPASSGPNVVLDAGSGSPPAVDAGVDAGADAGASTPDPSALLFAQGFVRKSLPALLGGFAQHPDMSGRFRSLVGGEYQKFQSYSVATPITKTGQVIVAEGCEPHDCGDNRVIVVLDLGRGFIHAGVANGTKIRVFSEDSKHLPAPIVAWRKDPAGWSNPLLH